MKVLHLSSEKAWRGGEQQIAYLIEELEKRGVENMVLARKGSEFEKYCYRRNIRVYGVPFSSALDLRAAKAIKILCKEHGIHLVHMHSAKSHSLGVLSAMMGNPVPLVLSRRVVFPPGKNWFTRWKYNHHSIKKIICVSDKIKAIMQSYLKEPRKSVTVHSGIDTKKFIDHVNSNKLRKSLNLSPETFLIGNTSALEAEKDYNTFIHTIANLAAANLPVTGIIMGSGSKEAELKALVKQLSLSDRIIFTGYREDVVELLPGLNIFLMTSAQEGLGTSVLDAFAAKVAVVATHAGGIPEMVHHGKTGLLAPIGDAALLGAHIARLISDPDFMHTLVSNGQLILSDFSKERTAEKTLGIYHEILQQS